MKPLPPHRSYDSDTSRILARLRNADSEFAKKERAVRKRCAQLLRRYRHRHMQRVRLHEARVLSDILRQTAEWKVNHHAAEEQKLSDAVRTVLRIFLENAAESTVDHVIREVRKMIFSQPFHQIVLLRVSPELENAVRGAFAGIETAVDPQLRSGVVVVQTPDGELEYSWDRHLQSILDLLSV